MNIMSFVSWLLGLVGSIPAIGPVLSFVVSTALCLIVLVNAFVAAWHGVIVVLNAIAAIPGLSGLKKVATSMTVDEAIIDDFAKNKILPLLSQISAIPVPKTKTV